MSRGNKSGGEGLSKGWPKRKNSRTMGYIPGGKHAVMLNYASKLQRATAHLLLFDHQVADIQAIESPISVADRAGKADKVRAGYWVRRTSGERVLVSCEPRHARARLLVEDPSTLATLGYKPGVYTVTAGCVYQGYRLRNVEGLWLYARQSPGPEITGSILGILNRYHSLPIGTLAQQVHPDEPGAALRPILALMYHGELLADLDSEALAESSPLWLPGAGPYPPSIFDLIETVALEALSGERASTF